MVKQLIGSEVDGAVVGVLLLLPKAAPASEVALPPASHNLFQRLIRNPHPESTTAKERECTEMLCSLLLNAPSLRDRLFEWMGGKVGCPLAVLNNLNYSIQTEQAIGAKRDDLRIVGWRGDEQGRPAVLWTVEVKVGASFHLSSRHLDDQQDGEDEVQADVAELVNQVVNYDAWLWAQAAEHRAGFVLALKDKTAQMPEVRRCQWACLSWTQLGEQVEQVLREASLPETETLLARHALGFIRDNLWRAAEMAATKLDFNDVALIRAYAMMAADCEEKVNRLVGPLVEVFERAGVGRGKVQHQTSLFKGMARSVVYRELGDDAVLFAGIGGEYDIGDYLSVWIESSPKHPRKKDWVQALANQVEALRRLNARWKFPSQKGDSGDAWTDIELTLPLGAVLAADDQERMVREFVEAALRTLKENGILDAMEKMVGRAK